MASVAHRRIVKDLQRLEQEGPLGICATPFPNDVMFIHAIIQGPTESEWESGIFHLIIKVPSDYPLKPPHVRFLTRMFHPNIYPDGRICLDILSKQWSPSYDLTSILASIQSLLADPNVESPASIEVADICVKNKLQYSRQVLKCVEESWSIPNLPADILAEID